MRDKYVYQYLVIDAQGEVHQGITTAVSRRHIMEEVAGNYGDCQYIDVSPQPNLVPEMSFGQFTGRVRIKGRQEAMW